MNTNYKKDLLLKGNAAKRLLKEYQMYNQEVTKLQTKLDELNNNGADEYDIRKQNEFLEESKGARLATRNKLRTSYDTLTVLVDEINEGQDNSIIQLEEYKKAVEVLTSVREEFEKIQE